jgi:hypothetical protein
MSKYSFERMLPGQFESMAQALLEKLYRVDGNLIQFGAGADGGREATWTQELVMEGVSPAQMTSFRGFLSTRRAMLSR